MTKDPFEQAEDILAEASVNMAAEVTKAHAEMTLFSAVARKNNLVGEMMAKAAGQSADYITGMMVAIGLITRNWGRILSDSADMDFTEYINPEAEAFCEDDFAHYLVKEILLVYTVPEAEKVRAEMKAFYEEKGEEPFARMCLHTIGLYAELIRDVLDIRNGDYVLDEGDGDDR